MNLKAYLQHCLLLLLLWTCRQVPEAKLLAPAR
jgi:hypothetical protein